jgi:hypothetical protein
MTRAPREDIACRFPLVARPRPCCHPLEARIRQVAGLASAATRDSPDRAVTSAAQACNFAALIASDCGLPGLARDLYRRQFLLFHAARPFDAATAKLALQPLINLGRLHARNGDHASAVHLTGTLLTAVRHQATVSIDGIAADFGGLTRTPDDHREAVRWLQAVLLADETRALAQAGRWDQALQHVRDHHGIGQGLLDGRQIAIIAHHAAGDVRTSADLLDHTPTPTPWEAAVAASLTVLTGRDLPSATLSDRYLALDDDPMQVVFRTRLGLTILDLAGDQPDPRLAPAIQADVLQAKDAYAARDVLAHPASASLISAPARDALSRLLDASGLGSGTMPPELLDALTATTTTAEASLVKALTDVVRLG